MVTEILLFGAILILLMIFAPAFIKTGLRPLLAVSLISALASAGRLLFASVPSVQPSTFLVMTAGVLFGPGGGLCCGVVTGLLSNLIMGTISPYTPWQALLWGLSGLSAGLIGRRHLWLHPILGFLWGFIFGWTMNLPFFTFGGAPFSFAALLAACAASFSFDLAHAIANASLLAVFIRPAIKLLHKISLPPGAIKTAANQSGRSG